MRKPGGRGALRLSTALLVSMCVLVAGGIAARLFFRGTSSPAHDPRLSRRAPAACDERVEGRQYVNRDLGLTVDGPPQWKIDTGVRSDPAAPYEGLVVKMEAPAPPDPDTQVRPLVSVVRRALADGDPRDPVAYIRQRLLTPGKTVVRPPTSVEVAGRTMGQVGYEMPSGKGTIRILQHVCIQGNQAIILSSMAPAPQFDGLGKTFESVLASLRLEH